MSELQLESFLPFRLSVLANRISRALARLYAQFDLTIPQWRVLAVLGAESGLSAEAVANRTEMDKVAVSRAVSRLVSRRLVSSRRDQSDRRRSVLVLSPSGRRLFERIIPLTVQYQADLISVLDSRTQRNLWQVLNQLDEATGSE